MHKAMRSKRIDPCRRVAATVALMLPLMAWAATILPVSNKLITVEKRSMTSTEPVPFYTMAQFVDLAAISTGATGYLVTVEHTFDVVQASFSPAENTTWRFWSFDPDLRQFREASRKTVAMPVAMALAMKLRAGELVVLAQDNNTQPAWLLSWPFPGLDQALAGPASVQPVQLDRKSAALVRVDPHDDWSTGELPSSRWLFGPSLTTAGPGALLFAAMNSAAGQGAVWTLGGKDKPTQRTFTAGALNPAVVQSAGTMFLLYRTKPAAWPMFFHDIRHSGQFGPVALPLAMAELDSGGALGRAVDLSQDPALGKVFDFAVTDAPDGRSLLAVIAGSLAQPELRMYAIEQGRLRFQKRHLLAHVPHRVTLAIAGPDVVTGLAYCGPSRCEVQGMVTAWK